jgi:hypothetical protein
MIGSPHEGCSYKRQIVPASALLSAFEFAGMNRKKYMRDHLKGSVWAVALLFALLAMPASAQSPEAGLVGTWKYLRNFTYVNIDERGRIFQCRILPDLNLFTSTGQIAADSEVQWEPVRFFSLYGKEVSQSGQDWGRDTVELRRLVMFLNPLDPGPMSQRMEFDKVPQLPTLCAHYLAMSFE